MGVPIHGQADGAVARQRLGGLGIYSTVHQPGYERVPQGVKINPVA